VRLDGVEAEVELRGDFLVRQAAGHRLDDSLFAG
jgi:hypothetical protein